MGSVSTGHAPRSAEGERSEHLTAEPAREESAGVHGRVLGTGASRQSCSSRKHESRSGIALDHRDHATLCTTASPSRTRPLCPPCRSAKLTSVRSVIGLATLVAEHPCSLRSTAWTADSLAGDWLWFCLYLVLGPPPEVSIKSRTPASNNTKTVHPAMLRPYVELCELPHIAQTWLRPTRKSSPVLTSLIDSIRSRQKRVSVGWSLQHNNFCLKPRRQRHAICGVPWS